MITDFGPGEEVKDLGGIISIGRDKIEAIVGARLFGINKLIIVGKGGKILVYEIVKNSKLKLIHKKQCCLEKEEEVDVFDVF